MGNENLQLCCRFSLQMTVGRPLTWDDIRILTDLSAEFSHQHGGFFGEECCSIRATRDQPRCEGRNATAPIQ